MNFTARIPRSGHRIATGVPAGSDIEYADEVTMSRPWNTVARSNKTTLSSVI